MELSESSLTLLFELWCRERGLELIQYKTSGEVVARSGEVVAQ